ncbi:MAG: fused response regulator/phosphatase [Gallionella sp.]|nr:fused response regulator/phosphatase [Gallionella sp.]MDD4945759.1 fused response regulator/phosphatase [Gallionella sp.]
MNPNLLSPLKILVVDDSNVNRQLLKAMLDKMGHQTAIAESGPEALERCAEEMPELVLMDVAMPGMSGFDAVRELRNRVTHWFPVIFLSAHTENQYVLQGLRAGGDDYLFKPVSREILQAKIQLFQIRLSQNKRLQDYRSRIEDEADTAREFIRQFTAMDKINDPLVRYFFKAADNFSGDLIAVARKPDNSLHVLLADSAGHGLTAALAVIPLTQPFYQMTAKGFDIPAIVREINRRVRDYLPLPRFVAAVMLSLNPDTGTVQVWNGGCPAVLLLSPDGTAVEHCFSSRQLPLGVVGPTDFDASLEYYNLGDTPKTLMLCSDGVTEIGTADGRLLEHSGLLSEAQLSSSEQLFDRVVGVIESKLMGASPQDDVALVTVAYQPPERDAAKQTKPPLIPISQNADELCSQGKAGNISWSFSVTMTAPQLKRLDVVPFLLGITGQFEGGNAEGKLFLVLSELFNNALDHGVLKLDSTLKNQPDGMELYYSERAARLAELQHGQIDMHLERYECETCGCLKITIKDSGDGFDYAGQFGAGLKSNHQRHGRGIALLNTIASALHYSGNGSQALAYVDLWKA